MNKKCKNIAFLLMLFFAVVAVQAQTNVVGIEPFRCGAGKEVSIPVALTNYDEAVALQLKLDLPFAVDEQAGCTMSDRGNGHAVSVRRLSGNTYLFVVFSPSNKPFRGGSGVLFHIPVSVPESCTVGDEFVITCSQQIISDADGNNICNAEFVDAPIVITDEPRPDLRVGTVRMSGQSAAPGGKLSVSWTVANIGELNTAGGWKENVSLVAESGERCFLGTVYHEGMLQAGGEVVRQSDFNLPALPGIDGRVRAEVVAVADQDCGELPVDAGNNVALSDGAIELAGVLTLEVPTAAILETYSAPVVCKLYRSGSRAADQTFRIALDDDARLQCPKEVVVKAGQSGTVFDVSVRDNDRLDDDSLVIMRVSGSGYNAVEKVWNIQDDELPELSIGFSKSRVEEGERFALTVTAEREVPAPLTVFLSTDYPKRFTFPAQAVIPQGGKSVTVEVTAVDDDVPDMMIDATFTAAAARHESGEGYVLLDDDDVPEIELLLTPQAVSESAGSAAIVGKVRRTTRKDSKVTIVLTDNADGQLVYSAKRIVLEPGVDENMFVLGVTDNALVDGTRVYDVTASVYISSCNCSASGGTAGTVSQTVTVLDDDGPSLSMKASKQVALEGGTLTLTLTRNTSVDEALSVSIVSDNDDCLEYIREVSFPVGASSVDVPVTINKNEIAGDDRTVTFTATAEGFTVGTCWMMITDRTLPDAVVAGFTLSAFNVEARGTVDLMAKIENTGDAVLPAKTALSVYFNGYLYTTLYTATDIAPGESEIVKSALDLPDLTGSYTMKAVVNEAQTVNELFYGNNSSESVTLRLLPRFTASVSPDKTVYAPGEKITLSGKAVGTAGVNAEVDVYVINSGYRQVLKATTDNAGAFSVEYMPYSGQSGHFVAGACYPAEGSTAVQSEFDIVGLKIESGNNRYIKVEQGQEYRGSICLSNPTGVDITDVKVSVASLPTDCFFDYSDLTHIPAGGKVNLDYVLRSDVPTTVNSWQNIKLQLAAGQGVSHDLAVYYFCQASAPELKSNIESVSVNMVKNEIRECELYITNSGRGETGSLTLHLPEADWISADRVSFPSLGYGESATLKFKLHPTEDMPYNSTYATRIAVAGDNGCSMVWNADFKVVSDSKGRIELDVIDEYTYYNADGPHVDSAAIVIKEPYSNEIVEVGMSGKDGLFLSKELPCGLYYCYVAKKQHEDAAFQINIEPSETVHKTVSLLYTPIRYSWKAEKTEVEDEMHFSLNTTFETNVPMPVVVVDFKGEVPEGIQPGGSVTVMAMVTNHGLVDAYDVSVSVGEHDYFTATPLITSLGTLHANTTQVVPVVITRKVVAADARRRAPSAHCTFTSGTRLFITYRRRCNFETAEWEYLASWGYFRFPTLGLDCRIQLPELPCIPVTVPDIWRVPDDPHDPPRPQPTRPVLPVEPIVNIPPIPWEDILPHLPDLGVHRNPVASFLEELRGCQMECFEGMVGVFMDLTNELKNIPDAERLSRLGRMNACVEAFRNGWNLGQWIEECAIPYFRQRRRVLEQNGSGSVEGDSEAEKKAIEEDQEAVEEAGKNVNDGANEYNDAAKNTGDRLFPNHKDDDDKANIVDSTEVVKDIIDFLEDGRLSAESKQLLLDRYKDSLVSEDILLEVFDRLDESADKWGTPSWNETLIDMDKLKEDIDYIHKVDKEAMDAGYADYIDLYLKNMKVIADICIKHQPKACTKVSMQFSQSATMTREAVKGYLGIENTNELVAMTDIELNMRVLDTDGRDCTHLFGIDAAYATDGITITDGRGRIAAGKTGTYTVLFIPTVDAAPEVPTDYQFTGSFSYNSPYTGEKTSHTLTPVTLTITPSPALDVAYFIQRDVFADDPLTAVVEQSVPAEMAVLVSNVGYGDAKNVAFNVQQPQIVDNEKGLLIDMRIVGSSFNGTDKSVPLGAASTTVFGTIPAQATAYAQWWLESSLLGHFTEYDVEATKVTSYGNDNLSLLHSVSVHELVHSIRDVAVSGEAKGGFLVNDIADSEDLPDMLYLTDGSVERVNEAAAVSCKPCGGMEYVLTLKAAADGWNYGVVADPTMGRMTLLSVRRADGTEMDAHNFWQTGCTLRDGKEPLYENRLHLADRMSAGIVTYVLTFAPSAAQYAVDIVQEGDGSGEVIGAMSGVYADGTTLTLVAVPNDGFVLKAWRVNGEDMGCDATLSVTITQDTEIQAVFGEEELLIHGYTLAEGWNWISHGLRSNVDIDVFAGKAERVIGRDSEADGSLAGGTDGGLTELRPLEAYKVKMQADSDIYMSGYRLNAAQTYVDLQRGWNWIGCPADYAMMPADAFLYAAPEEGDAVCGQDGFAVYENGEWQGTLFAIVSGNGYLYKSASDRRFIYHTDAAYVSERACTRSYEIEDWYIDKYKYPNTMNLIADLHAGEAKTAPGAFAVGAFCGEECRGIGRCVGDVLFLTVYGEGGEQIIFKALDASTEEVRDVEESLPFVAEIQGSCSNPYVLHLSEDHTGIVDVAAVWSVAPAVTSDKIYVSSGMGHIDEIRVTGMSGAVVLHTGCLQDGEGISLARLPSGVYVLTAKAGKHICRRKIVKY